jgi:hypothetical protein
MNKLLAPNGKPSNLTAEQYKLVRSKEFISWFGDWENDPENASKVVDENGEPMICYHGTFREFNVFEWSKDGGFYFTEFSRIAEMYATSVQEGKLTKRPNENPIVLKCFLNFRNPLRERIYGIVGKNKRLINIALKKGYDSLIISGGQDLGGYYDQYVAIQSNQIKLADGTNTTFDGSNPDIRFDEGGEIELKLDEEYKKLMNDENNFPFNILNEKSEIIGRIELIYREDLGGYQIYSSKVKEKGKGIGKKAYIKLRQILGKPIISDSSRTEDAENLWKSLERNNLSFFDEKIDKYKMYKTGGSISNTNIIAQVWEWFGIRF